jgi:hypothetical protein
MSTPLTDPPKPHSRHKKVVTWTLPREVRAFYDPGFVIKSNQERPTHKLPCLQVVGCKRHFLLVSEGRNTDSVASLPQWQLFRKHAR